VCTCRAHYPGEQDDLRMSVGPVALDGLRPMRGDSALAFNLSRPAQASLALRPAHLLARPKRVSVPRASTGRSPSPSLGSYQGVPTPPWAGLSPAALIHLSRCTLRVVDAARHSSNRPRICEPGGCPDETLPPIETRFSFRCAAFRKRWTCCAGGLNPGAHTAPRGNRAGWNSSEVHPSR
jgi:hypothetical protein